MKYRTVIELICDAGDKDEAGDIVGEYLKGDMDFGVKMNLKTTALSVHRVKRCAAICLAGFIVFSVLFFKTAAAGYSRGSSGFKDATAGETFALLPALKTKHKTGFREEWSKRHEEILKYL